MQKSYARKRIETQLGEHFDERDRRLLLSSPTTSSLERSANPLRFFPALASPSILSFLECSVSFSPFVRIIPYSILRIRPSHLLVDSKQPLLVLLPRVSGGIRNRSHLEKKRIVWTLGSSARKLISACGKGIPAFCRIAGLPPPQSW